MKETDMVTTNSPEETIELASRLAGLLDKGDLVALIGELGAGKTVFVKGIAKGIGIEKFSYVNSPSFVIMKEYSGRMNLYHFDVYRLNIKSFGETLEYERYFYGDGLTIVEWADKITEILPEEYLEVSIEYGRGDERKIYFKGIGERFQKIIEKLKARN